MIFPLKRWFWLISFLPVTACGKGSTETEYYPAETKTNIAYGSDPKQKMDMYLPAGRSMDSTKVLVIIHGGGWKEGDKSDFTPYMTSLQQRLPGYAIFNLNYRLAGNNKNLFPSQENDIKAAVEFIYSKRNEYRLSDKFVLLGASAGAHLALLQGYKYEDPVRPKAIISFFGPTELTALYNSSLPAAFILAEVTGGTPATHAAIYQQSSPVVFVNQQSPPTLLLQGGADPFVPPAQAELLKTSLSSAGVVHQYVYYPSESHGWTGSKLDDSFDKIALFLTEHVH